MPITPDVAAVAALIADPSRAAMLSALLGGYSLPAGELARHARISAPTASAHLAKLVHGGLLTVTTTGRHRYYSLKSKDVAQALESLALIAPPRRVRSLNQSLEAESMCRARTCYDHLAGALGVMLTQALIDCAIIEDGGEAFAVTPLGFDWFTRLGVNCSELQHKRRLFAVPCLDWSERRPHLAGALGAAIAHRLFDLKWVVRIGEGRAVKLTDTGRRMLADELGLNIA